MNDEHLTKLIKPKKKISYVSLLVSVCQFIYNTITEMNCQIFGQDYWHQPINVPTE